MGFKRHCDGLRSLRDGGMWSLVIGIDGCSFGIPVFTSVCFRAPARRITASTVYRSHCKQPVIQRTEEPCAGIPRRFSLVGRQFLFSTCVGEGGLGLESGGAKARDQGCSYQSATE